MYVYVCMWFARMYGVCVCVYVYVCMYACVCVSACGYVSVCMRIYHAGVQQDHHTRLAGSERHYRGTDLQISHCAAP